MKMLFLTIAAVAALAASAHAGDPTVIVYECEQMNPARDGIRCGINGGIFFIRIDSREDSPVELKKRTKYMVARMSQNFLATGGRYIEMRITTKDGKIKERTCSRTVARTNSVMGPKFINWEGCREWHDPDPGQAHLWKHFDQR